jgi:protein-S-isoprenylcysteine O-methyltransferase Ste14
MGITAVAEQRGPSIWRRAVVLGYGLLAYLAFLVTVLYYVGFLANVGVPKGIDEGAVGPLAEAVVIDVGLIALFGIQHSVMARAWFKDRWTRIVPEPIERSTFVLFASVGLLVIAWLWRPVPTIIWELDGVAGSLLWGVYGLGLAIVVLSTFQISHTEFAGLQQVYSYFQGRDPTPIPFQTSGFYQYVRHPMMTGLLLWFWATPLMTGGHLLLAGMFSLYIVFGTRLEERMLLDIYGDEYVEYRKAVPMFFPRPWRSRFPTGSEQEGTSK